MFLPVCVLGQGKLVVTNKEGDKDSTLARSAIINNMNQIKQWIKSGMKFGIQIVKPDSARTVGTTAREEYEAESNKKRSTVFVNDDDIFSNQDLEVDYLPPSEVWNCTNLCTPLLSCTVRSLTVLLTFVMHPLLNSAHMNDHVLNCLFFPGPYL
jgi:hypothetical protein